MPAYPYTLGIPNPPNQPSVDVPNMQINTNSIAGLISTDHIGFGPANGGAHNQVQLAENGSTNGAIPAGLIGATFETLYSSVSAGLGDLWFVRGASGIGIQLTGPGTPLASIKGYTFLPGGMLVQWGSKAIGGTSTSTNYPIPFPTALFIVIAQPYTTVPGNLLGVSYGTDGGGGSLSSFKFQLPANPLGLNNFSWFAIGN